MGQILGLGVTHFPPLSGTDENLGRILKRALDDPAVPERMRDPSGWPAAGRWPSTLSRWIDPGGSTPLNASPKERA